MLKRKKHGENMQIQNNYHEEEVNCSIPVRIVSADGQQKEDVSEIAREHQIEMYINERLALRLTCTPNLLTELVLGRLLSEGYIDTAEDVESIYICEYGKRAKVFLKKEIALRKEVEKEPTCCTSNKQFLMPEPDSNRETLAAAEYRPEWIFALAEALTKKGRLHSKTKGAHTCILMHEGVIEAAGEDIGRHNAMDKVLGKMLLAGYDRKKCILYTSGRVPTDMVEKVIRAGVPILVSKAVPTDEAVLLAKEAGLTLICKAWPDSYGVIVDNGGGGLKCVQE